jgi:Methylamine utilisation protein MauE
MPYVLVGCRCLIGLVFAVAAASKLSGRTAFGEFAGSVRAMRLLQRRFVVPVAGAIAAGEGVVALAMALAPAAGFALAAALLLLVTGATFVTIRRGARVRCRCFGASASPLSYRHMVRNSLLLAIAAAGLAGAAGGAGPAHPAGALVAAGAGLVGGAILVRFDDIIDLYRASPPATPGADPSRIA